MLLRFMFLFLNFVLVALAGFKLVPGWVGKNGVAALGGLYWVLPNKLQPTTLIRNKRIPSVVLCHFKDENTYVVALMLISKDQDGIPAEQFFGLGKTIQTESHEAATLRPYRVFPHKLYTIEGDPEYMKLYHSMDTLSIMPGDDWARLVLASGMIPGWGAQQSGPMIRGIYWIRPEDLGIRMTKMGHYIPCVVLFQLLNEHQHFVNWYLVVAMSRRQHVGGKRAKEFFKEGTHLGIPIKHEIGDLSKYWINLSEFFEVEGRPDIMYKWGPTLLVMPESGADELRMSMKSHGIVEHHHVNEVPLEIF